MFVTLASPLPQMAEPVWVCIDMSLMIYIKYTFKMIELTQLGLTLLYIVKALESFNGKGLKSETV